MPLTVAPCAPGLDALSGLFRAPFPALAKASPRLWESLALAGPLLPLAAPTLFTPPWARLA